MIALGIRRQIRLLAKEVVERSLVALRAPAVVRRRHRHEVLILAYHNVLPDHSTPCGDSSLHVPLSEFVSHLRIIQRTSDVIALSTLESPNGRSTRPRVIITFDDAYQGVIDNALPELEARSIPSTIFVAPALLGRTTWWDAVAERFGGSIPNELRESLLQRQQGRAELIGEWLSDQGLSTDTSSLPRIATEAELRRASQSPHVSFGSHTWSHPNLATLSEDDISAELQMSSEWLRSRFNKFDPILSLPYGRGAEAVRPVAKSFGLSASLLIEGGWAGRTVGAELPRVNIPRGLSGRGFELRLAGLFA
jgi:peptidoglycan/xylan/chitin deacetylase (PgdA/CDA1 family)